ncbi:putative protein TPRXL [Marmota marmota marmota]|uniref:putative protein TPRXL n=1 Tax=Marmota marmota marmota TaxID=9994 RepID=UPI002093C87C|nr:putative protein TPRXL [Marmota marmota marmota]
MYGCLGLGGHQISSRNSTVDSCSGSGGKKESGLMQTLRPELDNSPLSLARPSSAPSAPTPSLSRHPGSQCTSQSPGGEAAWRDWASGREAVTRTWIAEVGTGSDSGIGQSSSSSSTTSSSSSTSNNSSLASCGSSKSHGRTAAATLRMLLPPGSVPSPGLPVPGWPWATAKDSGGNPGLDIPSSGPLSPPPPDATQNPQASC